MVKTAVAVKTEEVQFECDIQEYKIGIIGLKSNYRNEFFNAASFQCLMK